MTFSISRYFEFRCLSFCPVFGWWVLKVCTDFLWIETILLALIFPDSSSWAVKEPLKLSFQNYVSEEGKKIKGKYVSSYR